MREPLAIPGIAASLILVAAAWGQEVQPVATAGAASISADVAQIRFTFDHPQLVPSHYVIVVNEDGKGHYESSLNPQAGTTERTTTVVSQPMSRDITISGPTRELLFATARQRKLFSYPCENNTGKVAFRGNKELVYQGRDGQGSCKFNWSKDDQIDKLSDLFQSLSFTLEEGDRLKIEQRHDRLALDAELEQLVTAAKDNRAIELHNIAPQLEQIAQDESVMARARQRARQLLQQAATQ
jgi:hypothetical protein